MHISILSMIHASQLFKDPHRGFRKKKEKRVEAAGAILVVIFKVDLSLKYYSFWKNNHKNEICSSQNCGKCIFGVSARLTRHRINPGVGSCEIENQGHKPKYMLKTVLIFAKMCTSLGLYSRRENRF